MRDGEQRLRDGTADRAGLAYENQSIKLSSLRQQPNSREVETYSCSDISGIRQRIADRLPTVAILPG